MFFDLALRESRLEFAQDFGPQRQDQKAGGCRIEAMDRSQEFLFRSKQLHPRLDAIDALQGSAGR